ncbi:hypothetical protein HDU96_006650 [Phlyctochytrium bullatum]|nr:hypothetical protein HDU96_006650 [Phlyctochytrium bullatum]
MTDSRRFVGDAVTTSATTASMETTTTTTTTITINAPPTPPASQTSALGRSLSASSASTQMGLAASLGLATEGACVTLRLPSQQLSPATSDPSASAASKQRKGTRSELHVTASKRKQPPGGPGPPELSADAEDEAELFERIATAIKKAKRCVAVTGAGISVSAGIPDFRSEDGLYSMIKDRYPSVVLKGRDLFDASLFRDQTSTKLFYAFMAELKSAADAAKATKTHKFLSELHTRGKLARWYTQNIDCLEALDESLTKKRSKSKGPGSTKQTASTSATLSSSAAESTITEKEPSPFSGLTSNSESEDSLPSPLILSCFSDNAKAEISANAGDSASNRKASDNSLSGNPAVPSTPSTRTAAPVLVKLHGDLSNVACTMCSAIYPFTSDYQKAFVEGEPPLCPSCLDNHMVRSALGKRVLAVGTLRPDVVLYGEDHRRGVEIAGYVGVDVKKSVDLMLVIGTSLMVDGAKRLVKDLAKGVRARGGVVVLINKTALGKEWDEVFDYFLMGECDGVVEAIETVWESKRPKARTSLSLPPLKAPSGKSVTTATTVKHPSRKAGSKKSGKQSKHSKNTALNATKKKLGKPVKKETFLAVLPVTKPSVPKKRMSKTSLKAMTPADVWEDESVLKADTTVEVQDSIPMEAVPEAKAPSAEPVPASVTAPVPASPVTVRQATLTELLGSPTRASWKPPILSIVSPSTAPKSLSVAALPSSPSATPMQVESQSCSSPVLPVTSVPANPQHHVSPAPKKRRLFPSSLSDPSLPTTAATASSPGSNLEPPSTTALDASRPKRLRTDTDPGALPVLAPIGVPTTSPQPSATTRPASAPVSPRAVARVAAGGLKLVFKVTKAAGGPATLSVVGKGKERGEVGAADVVPSPVQVDVMV